MSVEHVEVLVEEPSTEAALRLVLPRVLGELSFEVYPCLCKNDLLARLPERLAGYAARRRNDAWFREHARIVVLVDRDGDNCKSLKARLERMATGAGLVTKSRAGKKPFSVVNRLAIEELEAWYFGDWEAVRAAYPRVSPTVSSQARYRNPDAIEGGTSEAFERVLQKAGYFDTGLRKIEAARAVAEHMVPERNRSRSFQVFSSALVTMVAA
jgi:hypothetical protein